MAVNRQGLNLLRLPFRHSRVILVGLTGFEPVRRFRQRGLSPPCLPVPSQTD